MKLEKLPSSILTVLVASATLLCGISSSHAQDKKPNIVMLMTDDTGWNDFGCYDSTK